MRAHTPKPWTIRRGTDRTSIMCGPNRIASLGIDPEKNGPIIAAPGIGYVCGTLGATYLRLWDRISDGAAFQGERLVRLPRRPYREWKQNIDGQLVLVEGVKR